ncbi:MULTISPECIES: branched-chain amino acid ABC transporter permease [unclassified Bradyrhizobium]|uniref:branched-chain amino acid ABC transporter permease n=1 Tax=unclassified Bradyrhizobium TaxID=2631580 RepID=UPI0015C86526|nr:MULTISPECIES: branched-chain amino acid ABC transporter permease [unclassified Bradyrhizobium]NYG46826.1 branched-chain amino acid transport system permease protein [Bradyrhizobium sp. IAR9]
MRTSTAVLLAVLVVGAAAPFGGFYPLFLMKCLAFALFACSFNFFTGNVGLLSIGHAAFFGLGAYVAGHALKVWGLTPELALGLALLVGAALGFVMGGMAIRRQGIYFAMVTLALAQMVYFVCLQAPFTGAEDGLQRIPRGRLLGLLPLDSDLVMYGFVLVSVAGSIWGLQRLMEAPFGQVLLAIRDNEPRAVSLGYDCRAYKLMAFVISASAAALAGALKAQTLGLASLPDAHWTQSGNVILMCLLGGLGTAVGPIVGASFIVALEGYLADVGVIKVMGLTIDLSTKIPIVIGAIFILCVLMFRKGIVGEIAGRSKMSLRNARAPSVAKKVDTLL